MANSGLGHLKALQPKEQGLAGTNAQLQTSLLAWVQEVVSFWFLNYSFAAKNNNKLSKMKAVRMKKVSYEFVKKTNRRSLILQA